MNKQICEAIENKNLIEFNYDGESRTIEPHCYGTTTAGSEAVRGYQVGGYSSTGKMGWKLYDLSKADNIEILDKNFKSPRDGYKPGDKQMSTIFCEI